MCRVKGGKKWGNILFSAKGVKKVKKRGGHGPLASQDPLLHLQSNNFSVLMDIAKLKRSKIRILCK